MSTAIIVAIVALVSTIVGATIVAVTNYVLAVRRERAEMERDSRNQAKEVKKAARLIDMELLRGQAMARICIEKRRWWSADAPQLSTELWQKYNGIICTDLSDQAWADVTVAVEALDNIRVAREMAVDAGLGANAIAESTADQLAPMLRDIQLGRGALAPFVFDSLPATARRS